MNEEEFNMEQITQAIKDYMNKTQTVEEVLSEKIQEDKNVKESFSVLWESYKNVSTSRNNEELVFKKAAVRVYFYSILINIFQSYNRSDAPEEIYKLYMSIRDNIKELKSEKELLIMIRDTIKILEKYKAYECNYDLSVLLALINDKNCLMYDILKEDLNGMAIRLRGISYFGSSKREELQNINENIDYKVTELKLKKSYDTI